jgi:hypothetical protein
MFRSLSPETPSATRRASALDRSATTSVALCAICFFRSKRCTCRYAVSASSTTFCEVVMTASSSALLPASAARCAALMAPPSMRLTRASAVSTV